VIDQPLVTRIGAEYREMPGLRLSLKQAARLWQVDAATCETALTELVRQGLVFRTADGSFIAWPALRQVRATTARRLSHSA
jgi:DNA-binding transcriptional regulator YhcF (GntR family)